jgi:hypothetical protein
MLAFAPIAQASPASHTRTADQLLIGSISQGIPLRNSDSPLDFQVGPPFWDAILLGSNAILLIRYKYFP